MRQAIIVLLLFSCWVIRAADLSSASPDACSLFIVDVCEDAPVDALVAELVAQDEEECRRYCDEIFYETCRMFVFDRDGDVEVNCRLYDHDPDDYARGCDVIGGTDPLPFVDDCLFTGDPCDTYRQTQCEKHGDPPIIDTEAPDVDLCQMLCSIDIDCEYFIFTTPTNSCVTYSDTAMECGVFVGPRAPSLKDCTEGTSSTTEATTTEKPVSVWIEAFVQDAVTADELPGARVEMTVGGEGGPYGCDTDAHGRCEFNLEAAPGSTLSFSVEANSHEDVVGQSTLVLGGPTTQVVVLPSSSWLSTDGSSQRAVMTWTDAPRDLDLRALRFDEAAPDDACEISFANRVCGPAELLRENNYFGDGGAEVIDWSETDALSYLVFVYLYDGEVEDTLPKSMAEVALYFAEDGTSLRLQVPASDPNPEDKLYWVVGCLTNEGLSATFSELNYLAKEKPTAEACMAPKQ